MAMKTCGEIMIPLDRFPQLPYWFTLRQAMAELDRMGSDGTRLGACGVVLVFSAQNQLLGILRQEDILRGLKPNILAEQARRHAEGFLDVPVDPNLYRFCSGDRAQNMLREQIERPIGDFVRPIEVMLHSDDDLLPTIGLMIDRDLDFIPVLRDDRVAGLLSMLDVLQQATKLLV
jgi:CBS domain-containing protein